jgi:hypothetical protein
LIIGFVVGSLTFGVLFYLIAKSIGLLRSASAPNPSPGVGGAIPIQAFKPWNLAPSPDVVYPLQPSAIANKMQLEDSTSLATRTDTVQVSTAAAERIFSAPMTGPIWSVRLHVGGPAGSFVAFAVDALPSSTGGGSLVIPAGSATRISIGPRQSISGIAINNAAQVSYVASAEVL